MKKEFMDDVRDSVVGLLGVPKVSFSEVQSFAGCANHITNILFAWRPFISELRAAIYARSSQRSGKVWVRQI